MPMIRTFWVLSFASPIERNRTVESKKPIISDLKSMLFIVPTPYVSRHACLRTGKATTALMAGPTASTRNDPRLSLRLTDASPLGNVSA